MSPEEEAPDVRFDDVSLRYDRRGPWILRGVTAAARPGQVVVVTGRNGTGKPMFH